MKKAGIVGGLGPVSTAEYYKKIIQRSRELHPGVWPELVIESIDMDGINGALARGDREDYHRRMHRALQDLAAAGADFAAISSNTAHEGFERTAAESPIPVVSILETSAGYLERSGCRHVLVLGTGYTMQHDLYGPVLQRRNIEEILPASEECVQVQDIIFPKLEDGIVDPDDKARLIEIAENCISRDHADCVLLACTELPVMLKPGDLSVPLVSSTDLHVSAITDCIFSE